MSQDGNGRQMFDRNTDNLLNQHNQTLRTYISYYPKGPVLIIFQHSRHFRTGHSIAAIHFTSNAMLSRLFT